MYHLTVDGEHTVCGQDIFVYGSWGTVRSCIAVALVNLVDCPDCIKRMPNRRELQEQLAESHRRWRESPCGICGAPRFRCCC